MVVQDDWEGHIPHKLRRRQSKPLGYTSSVEDAWTAADTQAKKS